MKKLSKKALKEINNHGESLWQAYVIQHKLAKENFPGAAEKRDAISAELQEWNRKYDTFNYSA